MIQLILTIACEKDADNMTSRYGMANELFQLYFKNNFMYVHSNNQSKERIKEMGKVHNSHISRITD